MRHYQQALEAHLVDYKRRRLSIREPGEFVGRNGVVRRAHILPKDLCMLNILESVRAEVQEYLSRHRAEVRLHKYFHHLNSSQAFAFNLFFPFFLDGPEGSAVLLDALGVPGKPSEWRFEYVPDKKEGTNVDVAWQAPGHEWTFCEVKLSERAFGDAEGDRRHKGKLESIYRPRLQGLVDGRLLEVGAFVSRYQILRNVALLALDRASRLLFVLPRENEGLKGELDEVLRAVTESARQRIHIGFFEDALARLAADRRLSDRLREHCRQLAEKYVIPSTTSHSPGV